MSRLWHVQWTESKRNGRKANLQNSRKFLWGHNQSFCVLSHHLGFFSIRCMNLQYLFRSISRYMIFTQFHLIVTLTVILLRPSSYCDIFPLLGRRINYFLSHRWSKLVRGSQENLDIRVLSTAIMHLDLTYRKGLVGRY